METTFIYVLVDPRTNDVRYVGKTDYPDKRIKNHIHDADSGKHSHRCNWIRQLLCDGYNPRMEIVEECSTSDWERVERWWIRQYRDAGCKLTNIGDGGEGPPPAEYLSSVMTAHWAEPSNRKRQSEIVSKRMKAYWERKRRASGKKKYTKGHHICATCQKKGCYYGLCSACHKKWGSGLKYSEYPEWLNFLCKDYQKERRRIDRGYYEREITCGLRVPHTPSNHETPSAYYIWCTDKRVVWLRRLHKPRRTSCYVSMLRVPKRFREENRRLALMGTLYGTGSRQAKKTRIA